MTEVAQGQKFKPTIYSVYKFELVSCVGFANRVRNAQSRRHYPRGSPFALDWSREVNILPFVFNLDQMAVIVAWRVDHRLLNHWCVGSSPGIISHFSWVEKAPRFSVPLEKSVARG